MTSSTTATTATEVRRGYPFHHGRESVIQYPVDAGGFTTRVLEAGHGAHVVVCLHGAGSRADRFVPMMAILADLGCHVFALDFPGHGLADKGPDLDYTGGGLAAIVEAVLTTLNLKDVTLLGTSLGGHVAAWVSAERADLVASLVLVGAVGVSHFPEECQTPVEVIADGSPEAVRRKLSFLVSDAAMVTDGWVREESMINSSAGASAALTQVGRYLNDGVNAERRDALLRERRPDLPVLLIWGAEDKWTPLSMGEQAHRNLPGSALEVMPGCGHAPYFEDPDGFTEILLRHHSLHH